MKRPRATAGAPPPPPACLPSICGKLWCASASAPVIAPMVHVLRAHPTPPPGQAAEEAEEADADADEKEEREAFRQR